MKFEIDEFLNTKALMNQGLGVIRPPLKASCH